MCLYMQWHGTALSYQFDMFFQVVPLDICTETQLSTRCKDTFQPWSMGISEVCRAAHDLTVNKRKEKHRKDATLDK